jgi:hypothetical protein
MDSGHLTHVDESRIYAEATALRERLNEHLRHELKRASTLEPILRKMYFDSIKKEVE